MYDKDELGAHGHAQRPQPDAVTEYVEIQSDR